MNESTLTLGWREWCALPDLGIPALKAKVDTGAKTSVLHTFQVYSFEEKGQRYVRFLVHPLQKNDVLVRECIAAVKDERMVSDSGGHKEMRYIIETEIRMGDKSWAIEMSLTNRDTMRFRMLLGRRAMQRGIVVDPSASYINGKIRARSLYGVVSSARGTK